MKTVLILALLMILTSCRSVPDINRELIIEQCGLTFSKLESGEIDLAKSKCDCRLYEYSINKLGAVPGTSNSYPVEYCQKLIGNKPQEYLKLVNFLGDVRRDIIETIGQE